MAVRATKLYTPEEYLAMERESETKHEYIAGEIVAMAGASIPHNIVASNIGAELVPQLRGGPCRVLAGDTRLRTTPAHYCYPDLTVICARPEMAETDRDTLTNPVLIVEILSKSTEAYDRGLKFDRYDRMPSLKQYVLVAQNRPHVECFTRLADGNWLRTVADGIDAVLPLESIGCMLHLSEVYDGVDFTQAEPQPGPSSEPR